MHRTVSTAVAKSQSCFDNCETPAAIITLVTMGPDESGARIVPDCATAPPLPRSGAGLAVLDQAEGYRVLAIRSRDRGERESYEHIVELYVRIAEELETMLDG